MIDIRVTPQSRQELGEQTVDTGVPWIAPVWLHKHLPELIKNGKQSRHDSQSDMALPPLYLTAGWRLLKMVKASPVPQSSTPLLTRAAIKLTVGGSNRKYGVHRRDQEHMAGSG